MRCDVFVLLFVVNNVVCYNFPFFLTTDQCFSNECLETHSKLGNSLNETQNACNNFYGYTCDKWKLENKKPESEPFWSQYTMVNQMIISRLQKLLKYSNDHTNAKVFYNGCVNSSNENYTREIRYIINTLGGWSDVNVQDYNFLNHIVKVTKLLNIHPILKFAVSTDYTNTTESSLYIDPGVFIYPEAILMEPKKYHRYLTVYQKWIAQSLQNIYGDISTLDLKWHVQDVINFEIELVRLALTKDASTKMTVGELSRHLHFDCVALFQFLFEDTNIDFRTIKHVISRPQYLTRLRNFIKITRPQTISNYIIWSTIKELSRDTSNDQRRLNYEVDREILGVTSDITRENECMENTLKYFANQLVKSYFNTYMNPKTVISVKKIAHTIKLQFLKHIKMNSWLSENGRNLIFNKVESLQFEVAFPIKNSQELTEILLPKNYFISILKLKNVMFRINLQRLTNTQNSIRWPSHAFEVNAYYNVLQNVIILPLGILHPPFFDVTYPKARQYGALGSLIGHELSHSIDTLSGNLPQTDTNNYKMRSECIRSHYKSFGIGESYSIGENIADTVGLKLSYDAMFAGKKKTLSSSRLFFISFGQMWCEVNGDSLLLQDEHAPVRFRVSGALQNSKEFNDVYACKEKNPHDCWLW